MQPAWEQAARLVRDATPAQDGPLALAVPLELALPPARGELPVRGEPLELAALLA